MSATVDRELFAARLTAFAPQKDPLCRSLSIYSASIALADDACMAEAIRLARISGAERSHLYELVLQSYLFLGFPRMLGAADCLNKACPAGEEGPYLSENAVDHASDWISRGTELCKEVYDTNYRALKKRVEQMAPEIFNWMVLEGYGKVLSRPGLDIVTREAGIVACLIMENRPVQLHSHMRGALNVGASKELLVSIVSDLGESAGEGYRAALELLGQLD